MLRVKGLVRVVGQDRPVVVQAVHHVPHPPVLLDRAVAGGTRIVVIARGLSSAGLRASFAAAVGG